MKKNLLIASMFSALMAVSLVGCGGSSETSSNVSSSDVSSSVQTGTLTIDKVTVYLNSWTEVNPVFSNGVEETLTYTPLVSGVVKFKGNIAYGLSQGSTIVKVHSDHYDAKFTLICKRHSYEDQIEEMEQQYKDLSSLKNGCVFAGDSYFDVGDIWTNFYETYSGKNVFDGAISGSTVVDWLEIYKRLIYPMNPKAVVAHIGVNDINWLVRQGTETLGDANKNFDLLMNDIHKYLPDTKIYYFSTEVMPYFLQTKDNIVAYNQHCKTYCETNSSFITYLDSYSHFVDASGNPIESMFRDDKMHPTLDSFSVYTDLLASVYTLPSL